MISLGLEMFDFYRVWVDEVGVVNIEHADLYINYEATIRIIAADGQFFPSFL